MRRPWRTTAGGWHTETHDPHAHHHHESSDRPFSGSFTRQWYNMLLTSLIFVDFAEELCTLHGERPAANFNFRHGGRSCAATCQITREGGASLVFVWCFLVRLLLFHCMPAGRHSDSTPDSRRVRLYSRTVQAPQPL